MIELLALSAGWFIAGLGIGWGMARDRRRRRRPVGTIDLLRGRRIP